MLYLLRKQIIAFLICSFITLNCFAQKELNRPIHDNLPYYFGLTFGYSSMNLLTTKHPRFLEYDSVQSVEPGASGGVTLGLLGTLKINKRLQFRLAPQLSIGGARVFTYTLKYPNPNLDEYSTTKKTLTSTIFSVPLEMKFNSDRIQNFRVFMMGGAYYGIDLSSNSNARNASDLIKLKKMDFGYELGVGFDFYLKFVTLSPEIKVNNGLTNIHARDPDLKFSNIIDKLYTRQITFTINIQE